MIGEDKYFIFDNEQKLIRYAYDRITYFFLRPIFTFRFLLSQPRLKKKKYYISICAIFKNEAQYLREWIEYHIIVGINHFYLYNNFSEDNYTEVLEPYIRNGIVTLTEWPVKQGQMAAYEDCVDKYANETNWIAFIDIDETIVPNRYDNIGDALVGFENRPIVIAYWKLFGTSGRMDRDRNGLVIEDFWQCWRKYTNIGKFFYNTSFNYTSEKLGDFTMHSKWTIQNGRKLPPVNFYNKIIYRGVNIACDDYPSVQINHYFTKSYKEYCEKRSRGDAFFEINPRDEEYFYWHEEKCVSTDYNIRKYLIKLKKTMGMTES